MKENLNHSAHIPGGFGAPIQLVSLGFARKSAKSRKKICLDSVIIFNNVSHWKKKERFAGKTKSSVCSQNEQLCFDSEYFYTLKTYTYIWRKFQNGKPFNIEISNNLFQIDQQTFFFFPRNFISLYMMGGKNKQQQEKFTYHFLSHQTPLLLLFFLM